ncbi:MAG: hypothetical protein IT319_18395 [Anaerolineae bacterium]|nr:hypothetical protein [Anaerolineae bacterium]
MKTIMVQMSGDAWTREAMHHACTLARGQGTHVTLLRLVPVLPAWLGSAFGWSSPDFHEWKRLGEYRATAEDYGVELVVQPMQYVSFHDAVFQAACLLNAGCVLVDAPSSNFSLLGSLRMLNLERRLRSVNCQLETLPVPASAHRIARPLP